MSWVPLAALPNIELSDPLSIGGVFVFAPFDDPRIIELKERYPQFATLMSRFRSSFGVPLKPPVLLRWDDENTPHLMRSADAAASARDTLAAAAVIHRNEMSLIYNNSRGTMRSDYFWLYPWMTTNDYQHIFSITEAAWQLHTAEKFVGQSTPEISVQSIRSVDIDKPLMK